MNKQVTLVGFVLVFLVIAVGAISAVSITGVTSNPSEVVPGEIINIDLGIKNIFEYDVLNLNVKLDLSEVPFAPYQSSSEDYLDELKDDDTERFGFTLIALPSASSGIYKLPVAITYEDEEGVLYSKSELISITVNSIPELKVFLDDVILIKGQENIVSIRVINSGLSDVKFVYLNLNSIIGTRLLTENNQYLGDIDSDDFDNVDYSLYIKETAPSTLTLPIILTYKDSTNKQFTKTENIILKVYTLKEAQELGLAKKTNYTIPTIIIIVILLYFIRRYLKKRKRRKNRR